MTPGSVAALLQLWGEHVWAQIQKAKDGRAERQDMES